MQHFIIIFLFILQKSGLVQTNKIYFDQLIINWECLSKAESSNIRTSLISSRVLNLFEELLSESINEASSPYLLQIIRSLVTSKRVFQFTDKMVDFIFVLSSQCIDKFNNESRIMICEEALALCTALLRSKTTFIYDRIPLLINLFKKNIQLLIKELNEINDANDHRLKILAVDIEK